ncbi:hypothetical protein [Sedimentibacter sp.]|uniref:hypothetical protein n=1 Tax=Sedimentibacter sp. TaxID=1960295 RepID=UPI0028B0B8FB|nr:hypothetical protein [Sedimentibacter sp.]
MERSKNNQNNLEDKNIHLNKSLKRNSNNKSIYSNECPVKDADGNCLVPGVFSDSDEIGGG